MTARALIGIGWCIHTRKNCGYSCGHGKDGKVVCMHGGDCPQGVG